MIGNSKAQGAAMSKSGLNTRHQNRQHGMEIGNERDPQQPNDDMDRYQVEGSLSGEAERDDIIAALRMRVRELQEARHETNSIDEYENDEPPPDYFSERSGRGRE
jgi:hypothetical protein